MVAIVGAAAIILGIAPAITANSANPIWRSTVASGAANADRLTIDGANRDGSFEPKTVILPSPVGDAGPALAPIGADIIAHYDPHVFGIEQRAGLQHAKSGLVLQCGAGDHPAGLVLKPRDITLPVGMAGALEIVGSAQPDGWEMSLVAPGADAPSPGQAHLGPASASLPITERHGDIVLLCPMTPGRAAIDTITIKPRSEVRAPGIGTWIWSDKQWLSDPDSFARGAAKAGLADVAILLRSEGNRIVGKGQIPLLAAALRKHHIKLHVVDGDPSMVTPQGLKVALKRARLMRAALLAAGLSDSALELDIEPNVLPYYTTDPAQSWHKWASAVEQLSAAWGKPVIVDLPWWMMGAPGGSEALAAAKPTIAAVVVMDYRTDHQAIIAAAAPWLSWGVGNDVPIRIALESGTLQAEVQQHYARAATGPLIVSNGSAALYDQPQEPPPGATAFALTHTTRIAPERISFCGNHAKLAAAKQAVIPILSAWPPYAGLKVHQLLEPARCG